MNIDENDAATLNVVIATTATDSLVAARVGAPAEAGSSAGTSHIITSAASGSKADVSSGDAFQEHLICMICQEVLHNCVRFCTDNHLIIIIIEAVVMQWCGAQ